MEPLKLVRQIIAQKENSNLENKLPDTLDKIESVCLNRDNFTIVPTSSWIVSQHKAKKHKKKSKHKKAKLPKKKEGKHKTAGPLNICTPVTIDELIKSINEIQIRESTTIKENKNEFTEKENPDTTPKSNNILEVSENSKNISQPDFMEPKQSSVKKNKKDLVKMMKAAKELDSIKLFSEPSKLIRSDPAKSSSPEKTFEQEHSLSNTKMIQTVPQLKSIEKNESVDKSQTSQSNDFDTFELTEDNEDVNGRIDLIDHNTSTGYDDVDYTELSRLNQQIIEGTISTTEEALKIWKLNRTKNKQSFKRKTEVNEQLKGKKKLKSSSCHENNSKSIAFEENSSDTSFSLEAYLGEKNVTKPKAKKKKKKKRVCGILEMEDEGEIIISWKTVQNRLSGTINKYKKNPKLKHKVEQVVNKVKKRRDITFKNIELETRESAKRLKNVPINWAVKTLKKKVSKSVKKRKGVYENTRKSPRIQALNKTKLKRKNKKIQKSNINFDTILKNNVIIIRNTTHISVIKTHAKQVNDVSIRYTFRKKTTPETSNTFIYSTKRCVLIKKALIVKDCRLLNTCTRVLQDDYSFEHENPYLYWSPICPLRDFN